MVLDLLRKYCNFFYLALRTHFQLKYAFQSHALRKLIPSSFSIITFFKKIPTVLHTYSKTTEDIISNKNQGVQAMAWRSIWINMIGLGILWLIFVDLS